MLLAVVGVIAAVAVAAVVARGWDYDRSADAERLAVFRANEGRALHLDINRGSDINFIVTVTGCIHVPEGRPTHVVLESDGEPHQTVPLGQMRAISKGNEQLGSW